MAHGGGEIEYFTLANGSSNEDSQLLFFRMNSLRDRIKRREACFGEAWLQLQKTGFQRKAELPCFTDIPPSPTLIPDAPYSPATSPACYFSGPSRHTAATDVSLSPDKEAPSSSSSDDNICLEVPSGMRRGLVRAKRVARRRPTLCAVDRSQPKRRFFGPPPSPDGDLTAEFRRYIEPSVFEITKHRETHQSAGPPCSGNRGMWNGLTNASGALHVKSAVERSAGRGSQGDQRPPLVSMESTLIGSEYVVEVPALFHGSSSPARPRTPHVTYEGLPVRLQAVLTQSVSRPRSPISCSGTPHFNRAISLHEDMLRAFEAIREGALPDYFSHSHGCCPT